MLSSLGKWRKSGIKMTSAELEFAPGLLELGLELLHDRSEAWKP